MTIGEILDSLKRAAPDAIVKFDFGSVSPTTVESWRGIYAEAAIGFSDGSYGQHFTTVQEFREELTRAIDGRTYTGWKGGEFRYSRDTELHVDNRGNCSNTEIVRVKVDEYEVMLYTENQP